jgi:hypothetical protein
MADIEKLAVYDARIVQERPAFAVDKGALSLTNAPFRSIASTSSQMTFNIQVPSLNVFIDREFEWTTGMDVQFDVVIPPATPVPVAPVTIPYIVFGRDVAFAPHPLHSAISTMTATINDAVATINTSDILYEVARLTDYKVNRLQRTTPAMLDKYRDYSNCVGAINNPLASYFDGVDYDNIPNGAFWNVQFLSDTGAVLTPASTTYNGSTTGGTQLINVVNGVPVLTTDPASAPPSAYTNVRIFARITATEKLILSPFIFSEEHGDEVGLYGVNNIQLVFNFQTPSRVIRSTSSAGGDFSRAVSNVQFRGSSPWVNPIMNIQFLTPSLDIALPPRNVLPYLEYARYIQALPSITGNSTGAGLQSTTITLPQIPDMLLVYVKGSQSDLTPQVGDFYLPITRISVNFDNFAGLLSSHTTEQLYKMSVNNGLKMDWNTWNGRGFVVNPSTGLTPGSGSPTQVPLVGGFLVLKMGKDITLQSGQAPSVVGNYTLQFNFDCQNRSSVAVDNPLLYIVAVNSGFFETQSGSSRIIKGVLTEQDVISSPLAPMGSRASLERYVGGGFMSMLGTALNKAKDLLGRKEVRDVIKGVARSSGIGSLRKGTDIAEALGFGVSGGVATGGVRTGGRARNTRAMLSALM